MTVESLFYFYFYITDEREKWVSEKFSELIDQGHWHLNLGW